MKRLLASLAVLGGLCSLPAQAQQAPQYVCMDSTLGMFCLQLLREQAPLAVDNFLQYVLNGSYDNTIVHRSDRLITTGEKFVIQTGGYLLDDADRIAPVVTTPPVPYEFSLSNQRGTVAMATIPGKPDSATSQWFVNLSDNSSNLDRQNGGGTVFAQVVSGMEVVDAISDLRRANLSAALGDPFGRAFTEVPVDTAPDTTVVGSNDLVLIRHAYALEHLPSAYHCGFYSPQDTLTDLCDDALTFPVHIDGEFYSATLVRDYSNDNDFAATVDMNSLRRLDEVPAQSAEYDSARQLIYIPSVRVGDQSYKDVVWQLQDKETMRFKLVWFVAP